MTTIYQDLEKSEELSYHINDVICVDEKCEVTELSDDLIISEAKYVLSKYIGNLGFDHEDDFTGENGREAYYEARQNVKAIKSFLRKWDK